MGKITVLGKAERLYEPDRCEIKLVISVKRNTASEASKVTGDQCELLLSKLKELGVSPENVEVSSDRIDKRSDYHSNETYYVSERSLSLKTSAEVKAVNAVRSVIETGFKDVSISTYYSVSNEDEINKQLFKEAVTDSRSKAEFLAETMGYHVTGIDSANLDGSERIYNASMEYMEQETSRLESCERERSLSNMLKVSQNTLNAEVEIVWVIE